MSRLTSLLRATVTCTAVLLAPLGLAHAQSYPERPVKFIVPYPAGGGIDVLARTLGQRLAERWGQPVVVENRPGSGTIAAADTVAKAAADGYTLLLTSDTTLTVNPALYAKLPYDAVKDFQPITQLVQLNQLLLARPDVGAKTLADAIRLAKAHPDKYNYASYGSGSQPHLAMEVLKNKAGISVLHVPYKGVPLALNAVLSGEVQFTFSGTASSLAHIQAGRLVPLAIGGKKRLALVPDVPTFAELGYPEVPAYAWFGLFAPAGTKSETVEKIARDIREIAAGAEFQQREVQARGYESVFNTPAEFARVLEAERVQAARAVKISGAKVE